MKSKPSPSYELSRRNASPQERAVHDLNNLLGALRLRIDILTRDTTCMWAQKSNIETLSRLIDEALTLAGRLEDGAAPVSARRRRRP
jgi:hypothetical protein